MPGGERSLRGSTSPVSRPIEGPPSRARWSSRDSATAAWCQPPDLRFGEQHLEIAALERAGEAVLADDVAGQGRLLLLELPDLFLDRALGEHAVGDDGAILADAMSAVDRLGLDGRIPPRVEQHHVIRAGEVEAGAPCLERD